MSEQAIDCKDQILAELGYRAYGKTTGYKNYQGLPMPTFDELPPNIKTAWYNAAAEIRFHATLKDTI